MSGGPPVPSSSRTQPGASRANTFSSGLREPSGAIAWMQIWSAPASQCCCSRRRIGFIMGRITRGYERALRFVLAYPLVLTLACVVLIVASFFCYRALGSDLLPEMDEGGFILDYIMPAGSALGDTNEVLLGVEKILVSTPEVESTSRRTGLQLGLAAVTEANTGDFSVD